MLKFFYTLEYLKQDGRVSRDTREDRVLHSGHITRAPHPARRIRGRNLSSTG